MANASLLQDRLLCTLYTQPHNSLCGWKMSRRRKCDGTVENFAEISFFYENDQSLRGQSIKVVKKLASSIKKGDFFCCIPNLLTSLYTWFIFCCCWFCYEYETTAKNYHCIQRFRLVLIPNRIKAFFSINDSPTHSFVRSSLFSDFRLFRSI